MNYCAALADRLRPLGNVRFIVAPNTYHHLHVAAWAQAFPEAQVHASPDLLEGDPARCKRGLPLSGTPPATWGADLDCVMVRLRSFVEVIFFHVPSRTLIVTDLMQNFEADRVRGSLAKWMLAMGGALGPIGTTSMEIRMAGIGRRAQVRAVRQTMMRWQPVRVLLAHGKCYETDAVDEVRRAFRWAGE